MQSREPSPRSEGPTKRAESPEQLRAVPEDILDRLEIGYRDQDELEATAWVVEVVDPVLRPGGYGYRRLLGPPPTAQPPKQRQSTSGAKSTRLSQSMAPHP